MALIEPEAPLEPPVVPVADLTLRYKASTEMGLAFCSLDNGQHVNNSGQYLHVRHDRARFDGTRGGRHDRLNSWAFGAHDCWCPAGLGGWQISGRRSCIRCWERSGLEMASPSSRSATYSTNIGVPRRRIINANKQQSWKYLGRKSRHGRMLSVR